MFGLEKKKETAVNFDLESDLKGAQGSQKLVEYKKWVSERIESLKGDLRKGEDKSAFELTETLLHGYTAYQQVLEKLARKVNKG